MRPDNVARTDDQAPVCECSLGLVLACHLERAVSIRRDHLGLREGRLMRGSPLGGPGGHVIRVHRQSGDQGVVPGGILQDG